MALPFSGFQGLAVRYKRGSPTAARPQDLRPGLAEALTRMVEGAPTSGGGLSRQGKSVVFDAIPSACGSEADRFRIGGGPGLRDSITALRPPSASRIDAPCAQGRGRRLPRAE